MRNASRGDPRGAGPWPTGVREPLENAADEVPHPTKTRVLMRKARDADVYWSTLGIAHGAGLATSPVENAACEVPPLLTRVLMRKAPGGDVYWSTLASRERSGRGSASTKSGFSRARRTEPMCTGVHEAPWNAAREVPPLLTRVLVRKAPGGDVYWSTLASRERSGRGSATHYLRPCSTRSRSSDFVCTPIFT